MSRAAFYLLAAWIALVGAAVEAGWFLALLVAGIVLPAFAVFAAVQAVARQVPSGLANLSEEQLDALAKTAASPPGSPGSWPPLGDEIDRVRRGTSSE